MACSAVMSPLSDALQCSSSAALIRVSDVISSSFLQAWSVIGVPRYAGRGPRAVRGPPDTVDVADEPGEREQGGGERGPRPHQRETGDAGEAGDAPDGEAARGIHPEGEDGGPTAYVVGEPGPYDLGDDQGD